MAHRVDPNDWAAKRARQVQHAKDLKFNRANAVDEELTLKPKTNKRPGYLDSLDQIASKQRSSVIQNQLSGGDVFEKPLPATLALKTKVAAPSPGSDALGKAMRIHKGNSPKKPPVAEYIPAPVEPLGLSGRAPRPVDASELFLRSLRADAGTELDGTAPMRAAPVGGGGRPLDPRRRGSAPTITAPPNNSSSSKPLTPSKSPTKATGRAPLAPWSPAVSPRHSQGGSNGGSTSGFSPTQQPAVVRSRLSLLKKKIRRSEEVLRTGLGDGAASATAVTVSASAGFLRSRTAAETSPGREVRQAGSGSGSGSGSSSPGRGVTPRGGRGHAPTPSTPPTAPGTLRGEAAGAGAGAGGGVRSSTDLSARAHVTQSQSQSYSQSQSQARLESSPGPAYDDEPQVTGPQKQCPDCGRMFNPQPYERHVKICAKVFMQKARPFDSKMMRIGDNPELVALERKAATKERQQAKAQAQGAARAISSPSGSRANQGRHAVPGGGAGADFNDSAVAAAAEKKRVWKEQSEALRQAMKATRDHARAVARGDTDLPAYTPSVPDSSFIPCPHCGRRFSQKAGERHIPQCTNIKAKPKSLSKGSGLGGGMAGGGVAPGGGVGANAISKAPPPLPGRRLSGAGLGAGSSAAAKGGHSGAGAGARAGVRAVAPRR